MIDQYFAYDTLIEKVGPVFKFFEGMSIKSIGKENFRLKPV